MGRKKKRSQTQPLPMRVANTKQAEKGDSGLNFENTPEPDVSSQPKSRTGLLDMPAEILNYICELAVVQQKPIRVRRAAAYAHYLRQLDEMQVSGKTPSSFKCISRTGAPKLTPEPAISKGCKELREVVLAIYYSQNSFCLGSLTEQETGHEDHDFDLLSRWQRRLGARAKHLRSIIFHTRAVGDLFPCEYLCTPVIITSTMVMQSDGEFLPNRKVQEDGRPDGTGEFMHALRSAVTGTLCTCALQDAWEKSKLAPKDGGRLLEAAKSCALEMKGISTLDGCIDCLASKAVRAI